MPRSSLRLVALLLCAACAEPAPEPAPAVGQMRFAIRGRWPEPFPILWTLDFEPGPLSPEETREVIESGLAPWSEALGTPAFRKARAVEIAQVTFGWRRGSHGECVPFGTDPGVAHAGPMGPGTFVHLDANRVWDERTLSLRQAVLHEAGHVLGLDHTPDETAVMWPEPAPDRLRLAATDLAGLHSLYGGGRDGPADLIVASPTGGSVLRGVAPEATTAWRVFDVDGDGPAEIVLWRTDAPGNGALWIYRFEAGAHLARTQGPLYGVVAPGIEVELVTTPEDERLLVLEPEHGAPHARVFDAHGIPQIFEGEIPPPLDAPGPPDGPFEADLDGDGVAEHVVRRGAGG